MTLMLIYTVNAVYRAAEIDPKIDAALNVQAGYLSDESGFFFGAPGERNLSWSYEDLGEAQQAFYALAEHAPDVFVSLIVDAVPEGWYPDEDAAITTS